MTTDIDLRTIELPSKLMVGGRDLAPELLGFVDLTVAVWGATGHLSLKTGYGLVTTNVRPVGSLLDVDWDDPEELLGYGVAARDAAAYYPWNALRKMRMLARARQLGGFAFGSSLEIAKTQPDFPRDVLSEEERAIEKAGGPIRWRDFPYGGVVYRSDGRYEVMLGFSIWTQLEDHRLAGATADRLLELANPDA